MPWIGTGWGDLVELNNRFLSSADLGLTAPARARVHPASLLVAGLLLTGLPLTGLPLANWISPSASAEIRGSPGTQHRLLSLNGQIVKWGQPRLGAGAVVTVALATHQVRSDGATNCRQIDRFDRLAGAMNTSLESIDKELDAALRAWERVANITFKRVQDAALADIVVGTQIVPRGRAFANVSPNRQAGSRQQSVAKAMADQNVPTTMPRPPEQADTVVSIEKALICFNIESDWKIGFDGNLRSYDLRHTLMHEIGHAIGLDHPGVRGELMDFRYREAFNGLQSGDVRGVVKLYCERRD